MDPHQRIDFKAFVSDFIIPGVTPGNFHFRNIR